MGPKTNLAAVPHTDDGATASGTDSAAQPKKVRVAKDKGQVNVDRAVKAIKKMNCDELKALALAIGVRCESNGVYLVRELRENVLPVAQQPAHPFDARK
jgi:hypothetical protein